MTERDASRQLGSAALVAEFLRRQREMYDGGPADPVLELMAHDIVWRVPGTSPIAGEYRGRLAVLDYFQQRRDLAGGHIAITQHADASHADAVVQLADGEAVLGDERVRWRTAGVYRVANGKLAEVWLVPLEQEAFDRAWSGRRPEPFSHTQRVRPQDCAAGGPLGHPRLLEFLEAAFIEWWRSRCGSLSESLGPNRRLTLGAVSLEYLEPIHLDEDLRTEVACERIGRGSLHMSYTAWVADAEVARARSRYVPEPVPDDDRLCREAGVGFGRLRPLDDLGCDRLRVEATFG